VNTIPLRLKARQSQVILGSIGVIELAAGVACLLGAPSWIVLVAAPLPWVLLMRPRVGAVVGAMIAILVDFWLLFATMILTVPLHLPVLGTVIFLWTVLSIAAIVLCWRNGAVLSKPSGSTVALWAASTLGGVIWIGVMIAADVLPNAARYSWVMLGDSANNLLFARGVLDANGFVLGPTANPTPLPTLLLAIVTGSGRAGVAPADLLRHDIAAFDQVWALMIILTCFTAGMLAGTVTRTVGAKPVVIAIVGAGGSLLPLSWFFTGYPVEFGFLNANVALPIVFAAFIVYLGARKDPALTIAMLCVAATLLFAVWDPLVLPVAALGLIVVIAYWRALVATRGMSLAIAIVGVVQLLAFGLGFVLPGLLQLSYFLSAGGGAFAFHKSMVAALAVGAVVLSVVAFRGVRNPVVLGTLGIAAGSAVGLGALLFESRGQATLWTYYPLKFEWFVSTVLVVLVVGMASAVVARYLRRIALQLVCLLLVALVTVAFLEWTPSANPGYVAKDPAARVLEGDVFGSGDTVAEKVFRLTNPEQPNVLWHTNDPSESAINFWVLQAWAGPSNKNLKLKYAAYGLYGDKKISVLCKIIGLMGGTANVYTAERDLATQIQVACPDEHAHVVLKSP
jgi:hypothetical protein